MEFSFQINTIRTVGAEVAKKASKRKRVATVEDGEPIKQQKFNNGLPFTATSSSAPGRKRDTGTRDREDVKEQEPRDGFPITSTSPSQSKRKLMASTEDLGSPKRQKLGDSHPLKTPCQTDNSLHLLADVALSDSASRSPTPTQLERSKGGRPRTEKQFPRQKQLRVRTKLRKNRPVKNIIPCEIWQSILAFCPPEFLIKAREIHYFDEILGRNGHTWKLARLRHLGAEIPDPPPGMSEIQYAYLLTGSGCQDCSDTKARRTYWAFQRRWCENCLTQNVASVKVLEREYAARCEEDPGAGSFFDKIIQCIPDARFDSWNHYQWVGEYDVPPTWAKTYSNGQNVYFCRAKFEEMDMEVRKSSLNASSTIGETEAFFQPYIARNEAYVSKLQGIEDWWMGSKMEKSNKIAALKEGRETYFKARANCMEPPLEPEALELCPSYQRAKVIASRFTERSWLILESKLTIERDAAVAELAKRRWLEDIHKYRKQLKEDKEENRLRRMNNSSPEQLFVLQLADEVVSELEVLVIARTIAPEDVIHYFFRRVYDAYEKSESKPEGKNGKYRLIMDDARMVEERRLLPFLEKHGLASARKVKCPGCKRTNETRTMSEQMQHIIDGHYRFSPHRSLDDLCHMIMFPFPAWEFQWLYIEWPRNIPILAPHHTSTGTWNFRDKRNYQYKEPANSPIYGFCSRERRCFDHDPQRGWVDRLF